MYNSSVARLGHHTADLLVTAGENHKVMEMVELGIIGKIFVFLLLENCHIACEIVGSNNSENNCGSPEAKMCGHSWGKWVFWGALRMPMDFDVLSAVLACLMICMACEDNLANSSWSLCLRMMDHISCVWSCWVFWRGVCECCTFSW